MTQNEQLAVLRVMEAGLEAGLMTQGLFQMLEDIKFAKLTTLWQECNQSIKEGKNFFHVLYPEFEPGTAAILMIGASGSAKATSVIKKAADYLATIMACKAQY